MTINAPRSTKTWPKPARRNGFHFTKKPYNMSYEITGRIHKLYEPERKSEKFLTQELVLLLDGRYPEYPKFQFTNDHADQLQSFAEGDEVRIRFDLRGREWQGKYFTNLNGYRIEKLGEAPAPPPPPPTVTVETGYTVAGMPVTAEANIGAGEEDPNLPY